MKGNRDRGRPSTTFVKQMISDAGPRASGRAEPEKSAGNRDGRRALVRLQNRPGGRTRNRFSCRVKTFPFAEMFETLTIKTVMILR